MGLARGAAGVGVGAALATLAGRAVRPLRPPVGAGAGATGTMVPASFSSVCGACTDEGSPMSPTGVTGVSSGGRDERNATSAPRAMPARPMPTPANTSERFEGPVTIAAAMSCVERPESVAPPCCEALDEGSPATPCCVGDFCGAPSPCCVGAARRQPHWLQNFASSGLGAPQLGQNTLRP